ncbi:LysR family transcriptional regulator [Pyruvatibacter sp.]|uniref:LysR family transcriptional regulator n=1 Tax=Pyruvatibacter sp. TaxID=1981328 RepID=UPI003265984C
MSQANWDLYRVFLAVAEARSYSGAGRQLKLSHATVGRKITELEEALGTKLFVQTNDGFGLSPGGEKLKAEADEIASAVLRAGHALSDASGTPQGIVRVSTAATLAGYWLMPHMSAFTERYPQIEIEFVTDAWPASVTRREAEIVIRLYGPGEENLVGRKIARCGVAFYASRDYADANGLPQQRGEWAEHRLIGFAGEANEAELARWAGHVTRGAPTYLRCSSMADMVSAVRTHAGIAPLTCLQGDAHEDLVRVAPDKLFSATDVWLLAHPDLTNTPAVRAVLDFIAEAAKTDRDMLLGRV